MSAGSSYVPVGSQYAPAQYTGVYEQHPGYGAVDQQAVRVQQDDEQGQPPLAFAGNQAQQYFVDPENPLRVATVHDRASFASVEITLRPGEEIMADGGAMLWTDAKVGQSIRTEMGPCWSACKRSCAGESCFRNYFTGPGSVTFGFDLPGDMLPFAVVPGEGWILAGGSFVCGTPNLVIDSQWAGCRACLPCCGNEGAFFTRVTSNEGPGIMWCGGYGALNRHEIPAGKSMFVHGGLFFAASADTVIKAGLPGGCKGCCCGGETFCMIFEGPSVLYTQSRDPSIWDSLLQRQQGQARQKKSGTSARRVHPAP